MACRCMARLIQNNDAGGFLGVALELLFYAAIALAFVEPAEKRGLTEATETITVFTAMCIWSEHFAVLAYGFAGCVR